MKKNRHYDEAVVKTPINLKKGDMIVIDISMRPFINGKVVKVVRGEKIIYETKLSPFHKLGSM